MLPSHLSIVQCSCLGDLALAQLVEYNLALQYVPPICWDSKMCADRWMLALPS